ncbi:hypothetical protein KAU32_06680 [bacterium]|nr:hypothetical protein [bacterium]
MKRNLLVFVIVGLVLFGGCTENAVNSSFEPIPQKKSLVSVAAAPNVPIPKLLKYSGDINIEMVTKRLPTPMYFLNLIIAAFSSNEIDFLDCNEGKTFVNQVKQIIISYANSSGKNLEGIVKKVEKFSLLDNIPDTVVALDKSIIGLLFLLTKEALYVPLQIDAEFSISTWEDLQDLYILSPDLGGCVIVVIVAGVVIVLVATGLAILSNIVCEAKCLKCLTAAKQIDDTTAQDAALDACVSKYSKCNCKK